ncbi:hypothetical protein DXG03_008226 [Asterophora parasitica]|uniref:BTB domain-containing protein n=1 Tax=Asterophora parasitica TaxID=117018 RepID=A0A9P7G4B4_9AGAR|nr:hypothetical protein DXG03_008226 [Asterophora parasitica]
MATHKDFDAPDADIAFVSSDGVTFKLHKKHLDTTAGAFPPSEFHTTDEVVPLAEPSATLEIVFKFLYPSRYPELEESMPFELFADVAEAAEKYQVFLAIAASKSLMRRVEYTCDRRCLASNNHTHNLLRKTLPSHADKIALHALKHGRKDILDWAAIPLLCYPFEKTIDMLPDHVVRPWAIYYFRCSELRNKIIIDYRSDAAPIKKLRSDLSRVFATDESWNSRAYKEDVKHIGNFSDYLSLT